MKKTVLIFTVILMFTLSGCMLKDLPAKIPEFIDSLMGEDTSEEDVTKSKKKQIRFEINENLQVSGDTAVSLKALKVNEPEESSADVLKNFAELLELTYEEEDIKQRDDGSAYMRTEEGDKISCRGRNIKVSVYGAHIFSKISAEEAMLKFNSNKYLQAMKNTVGMENPEVLINRLVYDWDISTARVYFISPADSLSDRVLKKDFSSISMHYDEENNALIYELISEDTGETAGDKPVSYSEALEKCNVHDDNILRGCEISYFENENTGWFVPNYVFYFEDLNGIREIKIPMYDM